MLSRFFKILTDGVCGQNSENTAQITVSLASKIQISICVKYQGKQKLLNLKVFFVIHTDILKREQQNQLVEEVYNQLKIFYSQG